MSRLLFRLVRLFHGQRLTWLRYGQRFTWLRYLVRPLTVVVVAAGLLLGTGSWQSAYVAAVVASMLIFGWGLLAVAAAWIVWLPLAVGEELSGGDSRVHSLILLTALLWVMARRELEQGLRTQLAEGGDIDVRLRWIRQRLARLAPVAAVVKAAAGPPLARLRGGLSGRLRGGLRGALRWVPRRPIPVRWAAVAAVFAIVVVLGDDLLVALTGQLPLVGTYHPVNPIMGGDLLMAVAATVQAGLLAGRTVRSWPRAEALGALLARRSDLIRGAAARLRLLVQERSAMTARSSAVIVAFMAVLALWSDPMVALGAAGTVGVFVLRLSGRDTVGVGLAMLLLAGVLVVIERPGLADRPRLANHAASAAYMFLFLGVGLLICQDTGVGQRLASLGHSLGHSLRHRRWRLLNDVWQAASGRSPRAVDAATR